MPYAALNDENALNIGPGETLCGDRDSRRERGSRPGTAAVGDPGKHCGSFRAAGIWSRLTKGRAGCVRLMATSLQ